MAAQPRRNGRVAKRLTRPVITKIGEGIERGYALDGAAAHAGIPTRTFWEWLARGRNGSGTQLEVELAAVCDVELAMLKSGGMRRVLEDEDWRAVAWYLERRWPDEFGPPERRVRHGGAVGLYAAITPERLRAALDSGQITSEDASTFARVWQALVEHGGDLVDDEVLELEAGDQGAEAA